MANVVKHTLKGASVFRLFTKNNNINFTTASVTIRISNENTSSPLYPINHHRLIHTNNTLLSRIKWRYTHKPFFHTKKTAKAEQSPLTASNRAFLDMVLQDTYHDEQLGEKYAYVA